MAREFDKAYWDAHWQQANAHGSDEGTFPNPHLARETRSLKRGTALDAGCGEGSESIWLATEGWHVTAVDISAEALSRGAERLRRFGLPSDHVEWIEADLSAWEPKKMFDLVTTQYVHPATSQLDFYRRISHWVSPGGTLLIIAHAQAPDPAGHGHANAHPGDRGEPPMEAIAAAAGITATLGTVDWDIVTAKETTRIVTRGGGREAALSDVVVRATRR